MVLVYSADNKFWAEVVTDIDSYLEIIKNYQLNPYFIPLDADGVAVIGDMARTLYGTHCGDVAGYDKLSKEALQETRNGQHNGAYGLATILSIKSMQEKGMTITKEDISSIGRKLPCMFGAKQAIKILKKHGKKITLFSSMYQPALDEISSKLEIDGVAIELKFDENGRLLKINPDDYLNGKLRCVGGSYKLEEIEKHRIQHGVNEMDTSPIGDGWSDMQSLLYFANRGGSIAFNPKGFSPRVVLPKCDAEMCPSNVAKINVYSMNLLALVPLVVRNTNNELQRLYTENPSPFLPEMLVVNSNDKPWYVLGAEELISGCVNKKIHEMFDLGPSGIY